jgi:hypothetical protein
MSVLYRALWTDPSQNDVRAYADEALCRFSSWALEGTGVTPLSEGTTKVSLVSGRERTIDVRPVESGTGTHGLEAIARDQPGQATSWTTLMRVVEQPEMVHVLVENQMESDDLTLRVSVGRPRFVDDLLSIPGQPVLGGSAVFAGAQSIPAKGISILTDILTSPGRTLPVIVCSEPGGDHDDQWLSWTNRIATRVAGIACVLTLDKEAVSAFRQAIGGLAIWNGGVRIYAPVPVTDVSEGWRHRYTPGSRMVSSTSAMIDRIVYSVAQISTRRRVPGVFNLFAEPGSIAAETPVGYISAEVFDEQRTQWEFAVDLEITERSEVEKELARANGHLTRLKDELLTLGLGKLIWSTRHEVTASIPDEAQDTSEAVLAAQTYLSDWLVLPDSAVRELEDIDTAPSAFAWGNTTWRGLRALAAYAKDRANGWNKGGFWEWCAEGSPLSWPATSKKLSMTESETVQKNSKLRDTRIFKVASEINPNGQILMLAHLKIAEGGGHLAPRVYFHDDTGGATGKAHVGFVGPHYLVPNKQAN